MVWMLGSSESPDSFEADSQNLFKLVMTSGAKACVFDRGGVMGLQQLARPPGNMFCGHGCTGSTSMMHAQLAITHMLKTPSIEYS